MRGAAGRRRACWLPVRVARWRIRATGDTHHTTTSAESPIQLPSPLSAVLTAALRQIAEALGSAGIDWLVAGGTARALSGFATTPNDLDIEVASADMDAAAAALGLSVTDARDATARSRRATGSVAGVDVDLTAGLVLTGPGGVLPPDFDLMTAFATTVDVGGRAVPVMPVEEQIVRILVTGDEERRPRFVREAPDGFVARDDYVSARLGSARATR